MWLSTVRTEDERAYRQFVMAAPLILFRVTGLLFGVSSHLFSFCCITVLDLGDERLGPPHRQETNGAGAGATDSLVVA
jgi:hypothetical protein